MESHERSVTCPLRFRNRLLRVLIISGIVITVLAMSGLVTLGCEQQKIKHAQDVLEPFYTPPSNLSKGLPGDILRAESMPIDIANAQAWRILYLSELQDGQPTVTSGMIIAPQGTPPPGGRPVVAWAHGTAGMGESCAPSRSAKPYDQMTWLEGMIANGWVITATDYTGLGTPGVLPYLVGRAEAYDVINSVRAAIRLQGTGAGTRYATWGHSQGGHASLWAAQIAYLYAPELQIVGAAAAAPASELASLMSQQYDKVVAWVIGPEAMIAWSHYYPRLTINNVITRKGNETYVEMSQLCLLNAMYATMIRGKVMDEHLFSIDPMTDPVWRAVAEENTPSPPGTVPVLIVQGLADTVVLPNTTSLLTERFYAASNPLTVAWLANISHFKVASVGGPLVNTWLQQRFTGIPATSTRGTANPVPPAQLPLRQ